MSYFSIEKYNGSKVPGSKVQRLKIGDLRCQLAGSCFIYLNPEPLNL
jgi:hypothetical protein